MPTHAQRDLPIAETLRDLLAGLPLWQEERDRRVFLELTLHGHPARRLRADPAAFPEFLHQLLHGRPVWLLILDQLEKLFTPAADTDRDAFIDLLLRAVEEPQVRVIATLRSDFTGAGGRPRTRRPGPARRRLAGHRSRRRRRPDPATGLLSRGGRRPRGRAERARRARTRPAG